MRSAALAAMCLGLMTCHQPPVEPPPLPAIPSEVAIVAPVIPPRPVPDPERYPVWGVDVSHHQERIDWAQVATEPRLKFAYIKATEGGNFVDKRFLANWKGARAAGLAVGAYHFFSFCRSGEVQAEHFLSIVPRHRDALPSVVDVEFYGNCTRTPSVEKVRAALREFVARVERTQKRRPIIYAPPDAYEAFIKDAGFEHAIWTPSVGVEPPQNGPLWTIWQFTATGRVAGIRSDVDMDVLAGGMETIGETVTAAR